MPTCDIPTLISAGGKFASQPRNTRAVIELQLLCNLLAVVSGGSPSSGCNAVLTTPSPTPGVFYLNGPTAAYISAGLGDTTGISVGSVCKGIVIEVPGFPAPPWATAGACIFASDITFITRCGLWVPPNTQWQIRMDGSVNPIYPNSVQHLQL